MLNWKKNLISISLSQFMTMAGFGCCMPFIPLLLKHHLHIDNDSVRGVYVSLYYLVGMVGLTIAYPIWGALADKFGRKIMVLRASYIAGLLYPLLAFAPNFWCMLVLRAITSLFSGTVNPAQTMLITTLPKEKHGLALGLMSTAIWSGDMTGYLCGGVMVDHCGYKVAFMTCGAIYLLSGILVHICAEENFVRPSIQELEKKREAKKKPSLISLLTPCVSGLLIMFLFMGIARRIESPFIAMLVEKINGETKAATITGYTSAYAAAGGIIAGLIIGKLINRYSPKNLLIPIIAFSGIFAIAQGFSPSIRCLQLCRFMTFMAAGCLQPVLQVMLTRITPPAKHGSYLGWTASLNSAGGILCSFISAPLAYYIGVRGIVIAAGIIFLLMFAVLPYTIKAYNRESKNFPQK